MGWTLITGASGGLGKAIALRLAEEGRSLYLHYHKSSGAAQDLAVACSQKGAKVKVVGGDFSTDQSVSRFLEQIEDVAHLVNNVGTFHIQPGSQTSCSKWKELYQLNFFAPLALIEGCMPAIVKHRGNIVNIGSVGVGICRADAKFTAYTGSKMSLYFLTKSMAKELASQGVRVNMVSPGEMENSVSFPRAAGELPMGRKASLKETAEAVAFFLDPANGYITGQNLEVGGGIAL